MKTIVQILKTQDLHSKECKDEDEEEEEEEEGEDGGDRVG